MDCPIENDSNKVLEYYEKFALNSDLPKYFTGSDADLSQKTLKMKPIEEVEHRETIRSPRINVVNHDRTSPCSSRKLEWDNGADIGYSNSLLKVSPQKSASFPSVFTNSNTEKSDMKYLRSMYHKITFSSETSSSYAASLCKESSSRTTSSLCIPKSSSTSSHSSKQAHTNASSSSKKSNQSAANSSRNKCIEYLTKIGYPAAKSTPNEEEGGYTETPIMKQQQCKISKKKSNLLTKKEINLCLTKPIQIECFGNIEISNKQSQTSFNSSSKSVQTDTSKRNVVHANLALVSSLQTQQIEFVKHDAPVNPSSVSDGAATCKSISSTEKSRVETEISLKTNSKKSDENLLAEMISLKHSHDLNTDIKRSIDILQKLLKSKKYDQATKKFYIKKIVEKIVDTKYSEDSTSSSELFQPKVKNGDGFVNLMDNKPWYPANQKHTERSKDEMKSRVTSAQSSDGFVYLKPDKKHTVENEIMNDKGSSSVQENWRVSKTSSELLVENREKRIGQGDYLVSVATNECQHKISSIKNEIEHLVKLKKMLEKKNRKQQQDRKNSTNKIAEVISSLVKMRVDDMNEKRRRSSVSSYSKNLQANVMSTEQYDYEEDDDFNSEEELKNESLSTESDESSLKENDVIKSPSTRSASIQFTPSKKEVRRNSLQCCCRKEFESDSPLEGKQDVPTRDRIVAKTERGTGVTKDDKTVEPAPEMQTQVICKCSQTTTHEEKRIQHPGAIQCTCQTEDTEDVNVQFNTKVETGITCDCCQCGTNKMSKQTTSSGTSSCSSSSSFGSSKSHMSCLCCKKKKLLKNLTNTMPLCDPCQMVNQTRCCNQNALHPCKCYSLIEQDVVCEIKNTLNELERLDVYQQYCDILKNDCKDCKKCGGKCKLPKKYKNGFAYFLKFEETNPNNAATPPGPGEDEEEYSENDYSVQYEDENHEDYNLPEVTIKVPRGSREKTQRNASKNRRRQPKRSYGSNLQSYLSLMKPDFIERAEWRRKVLRNAALERTEDVEARKLKYIENVKNLKEIEEEVPTKDVPTTWGPYGKETKTYFVFDTQLNDAPKQIKPRVFRSFKEMKDLTRRRYLHLSEVRSKKDLYKEKRLREANRLLANTFTKRLQKSTLRGAVDIPHSVRVISY